MSIHATQTQTKASTILVATHTQFPEGRTIPR